jgi:hypothetical protein|tara:strand:+ start:613 stop:900 length:288 start_codon:yes stop_codon:yes gene_type:complete
MKKSCLKLIVDNTGESKLRSLLTKQKKLIKSKIQIQDQIKAMQALTVIYGDEITKIENELLKINRRKTNVKRAIEQFRNTRTNRNKNKNSNGDVV